MGRPAFIAARVDSRLVAIRILCPAFLQDVASGVIANTVAGLPPVTNSNFMTYYHLSRVAQPICICKVVFW